MGQQKITQVHHTNQEDLTTSISLAIEKIFDNFKEKFQPKEQTTWITRKQVAEILAISLVTVDDWTKRNILTAYRISNKKRYKRQEVESALTKIGN
jgi:excisionase family DNA binding protein